MRPTLPNQSSFAFLALCINQAGSISYDSRERCMRGNKQLLAGEAKALEGNWKQAARIWNHLANMGKDQVCGKAAYNMVVACEILDRRDLAIQWARKIIQEYKSYSAKMRAVDYLHSVNEPFIIQTTSEYASVKN